MTPALTYCLFYLGYYLALFISRKWSSIKRVMDQDVLKLWRFSSFPISGLWFCGHFLVSLPLSRQRVWAYNFSGINTQEERNKLLKVSGKKKERKGGRKGRRQGGDRGGKVQNRVCYWAITFRFGSKHHEFLDQ